MKALQFREVVLIAMAALVSLGAQKDDGWLGGKDKNAPLTTGVSLVAQKSPIGSTEVWALKLSSADLVPDVFFSPKGDSCFLLDTRGVLRKVDTATMTERVRLSLGFRCSQLSMSKTGLIASSEDSKTHWLVSAESMNVIRKVNVNTSSTWRLATSAGLEVAFLPHVQWKVPQGEVDTLARVDLRTGQLSKVDCIESKEERSGSPHDQQLSITDDGRFAFATNNADGVFRYRIEGNRFVYEDRSHDEGNRGPAGPVMVLGEGKFVCAMNIAGDCGHRISGRPGVYVYDAKNLKQPAMVLPAKYGMVLDLPRSRAFGLEYDCVIGMDLEGRERWVGRIPEGDLVAGGGAEGGLWLSPNGETLIVRAANKGVYLFKVPKDLLSVQEAAGNCPSRPAGELSLYRGTRVDQGYAISELRLRPQEVLSQPLFDPEERTLTVLSPSGILSQYGVSDGKCLNKVDIGRKCVALGRSSEGLIILTGDPAEADVVDPASLAIRRRIPLGQAAELACSDNLPWGFVLRQEETAPQSLITQVDFSTGRISRTMASAQDMLSVTSEAPTQLKTLEGRLPRLSSDGRHLFTLTSKLHRWHWDGSRFQWLETADCGASSAMRDACFSDDRAYISLSGPANAVYWTRNLKEPVLKKLSTGPAQYETGPTAADSRSGSVYVIGRETLHVFDAGGRKTAELFLPSPPANFQKQGGSMTSEGLFLAVQEERKQLYSDSSGLMTIVVAHKTGRLLVFTGYTSCWLEKTAPAQPPVARGPDGQWLGDASQQARLAAGAAGKAAIMPTTLPVQTREAAGATCTILEEKVEFLVPSFFWSDDGKRFFLLQKDGVVREITLDPIRETRRLQLPQRCHVLAQGKQGLLVGGSQGGDLYCLDKETMGLKWRCRISQGPIGRIFSSPKAENALVEVSDTAPPSTGPFSRLVEVQLQTGKIEHDKVLAKLKVPRSRLDEGPEREEVRFPFLGELAALHPDGRSLWTISASYALTPEGILKPFPGLPKLARADSPRNMDLPPRLSRLQFSDDGRYLALQSGDKIRDFPKFDYAATFILRSQKPDKPLVMVEHGQEGGVLCFADKRKFLLEYTCDHKVRVYRGNGDRVAEYDFKEPSTSDVIECISVQPDGLGLLVMTRSKIFLIRLPETPGSDKPE